MVDKIRDHQKPMALGRDMTKEIQEARDTLKRLDFVGYLWEKEKETLKLKDTTKKKKGGFLTMQMKVGDSLYLLNDDGFIILKVYRTDETKKPYSLNFDSSEFNIHDGPPSEYETTNKGEKK